MKKFFKDVFNDNVSRLSFLSTFIIILLSLIIVFFYYNILPPLIPIFNQMPWGDQRLGDKITIFIPIGITTLIFISNLVFSSKMYSKIPLVARMLSLTTFLVSTLIFLFILKTIFELT